MISAFATCWAEKMTASIQRLNKQQDKNRQGLKKLIDAFDNHQVYNMNIKTYMYKNRNSTIPCMLSICRVISLIKNIEPDALLTTIPFGLLALSSFMHWMG